MKSGSSRVFERFVAASLILVGLAFFSLLAFLRVRGALAGDLKVSAFLLCTGALLMCVGCTWLLSTPQPLTSVHDHAREPGQSLLGLRRPVEWITAAGLVFTAVHAAAILCGRNWVPTIALWALFSAPVLIGLFALRILKPGAFQSGLFPDHLVSSWSGLTRDFVNLLLRIGWLGYPALIIVWPGFQNLVVWNTFASVQFIATILIVMLYASQLFALHFGQKRIPSPARSEE